jgi:hypothetical protein
MYHHLPKPVAVWGQFHQWLAVQHSIKGENVTKLTLESSIISEKAQIKYLI